MSTQELKLATIEPDIKPYDLQGLADDMLKQENIIAGTYILLDKDEITLIWNSTAITKKDMLWALYRMVNSLMEEDDE